MLRLDPAYPPLWRTPRTLQLGLPAVAVLDDPQPWQERLIDELAQGLPENAVDPVAMAFGAPEAGAEQFLASVAAALVRDDPAPRPVTIAGLPGTPVATGLQAAGWQVREDQIDRDAAPVVIVGYGVIDPRRAAALSAADTPHLPVVFCGHEAEVGPIVVPGRTACLACLAAHRRDRDPHWPVLAAQFIGRPVPEIDRSLALEAGLVAARLLSEVALPGWTPRSVTLHRDGVRRRIASPRPHPDCRCRSLARSATPSDRADLAPTSPTALAVPA